MARRDPRRRPYRSYRPGPDALGALFRLTRIDLLHIDTDLDRLLWERRDRAGVELLGNELDAAGAVRRPHEVFDPGTAELGSLGFVEHESQRYRRVQPERAAAARLIVGVLP